MDLIKCNMNLGEAIPPWFIIEFLSWFEIEKIFTLFLNCNKLEFGKYIDTKTFSILKRNFQDIFTNTPPKNMNEPSLSNTVARASKQYDFSIHNSYRYQEMTANLDNQVLVSQLVDSCVLMTFFSSILLFLSVNHPGEFSANRHHSTSD